MTSAGSATRLSHATWSGARRISRAQEEDYLQHKAADATTVLWAILADDRHIGSALIHEIDGRSRTGATSIVLGAREVWGEGYATEEIGLRSAYAFGELGLETLTTEVFAPNEGSRRALEEAGYRQAGLLRRHVYLEGAFHDVWLGELLRAEWQATTDAR